MSSRNWKRSWACKPRAPFAFSSFSYPSVHLPLFPPSSRSRCLCILPRPSSCISAKNCFEPFLSSVFLEKGGAMTHKRSVAQRAAVGGDPQAESSKMLTILAMLQ
jgi:hypothetical protein